MTPAEPVDDAALVRDPVRHPFVDEVLYFTLPDRFNDGDAANNCGDFAGACVAGDTQENVLTHGYLPSDKGYYHGGDLEGLRRKLPYLDRLGITAIWVGPIYANKPVQPDTTNLYGHSSGYHGYWIQDFLRVDPHLGTNAEFAPPRRRGPRPRHQGVHGHRHQPHRRRHPARGQRRLPQQARLPLHATSTAQPFDDSRLRLLGPARLHVPRGRRDVVPVHARGAAWRGGRQEPGWLNDPLLYHNRGNTSFTGENSLYGDFFGLDDLWTERREVVEGMVDIYSFWIEEFGVDGFRIDTTKHVNMEFWQVFGPDILAAAEARGIDDFFAFGEVFDQQFGPPFMSEFSTAGRLQSTIDFALPARAPAGSPRRADHGRPARRSSPPTTTTPTPTATPTPCRRSSGTTTWAASATSCSGSTSPAPATPSCWPGRSSPTP